MAQGFNLYRHEPGKNQKPGSELANYREKILRLKKMSSADRVSPVRMSQLLSPEAGIQKAGVGFNIILITAFLLVLIILSLGLYIWIRAQKRGQ